MQFLRIGKKEKQRKIFLIKTGKDEKKYRKTGLKELFS